MPRFARIVVPGAAHHITQRGNNRQDVFFVEDDYRAYLRLLKTASAQFGIEVQAYCLMTNHIHIVGTPSREDSLAKAIGRTHLLYAQYINRLHNRSGHLWQNRFFSCALDERYYWNAVRYVERNPVRARMVRLPWRHPWSSAAAHTGGVDTTGLLDIKSWRRSADAEVWRATLLSGDDSEVLAQMRIRTQTGRPLGSDSFVSKVEALLGRRVRALPEGRPKG